MPRASRIMPEHQAWRSGDRLWMYPPEKLGGVGGAPLIAYRPGRYIVFAARQLDLSPAERENGTWGFYLDPTSAGGTRLLVRSRAAGGMAALAAAFHHLFFEPAHYVMERRMLLGLKTLAEGREPSKATEIAEVATWTATPCGREPENAPRRRSGKGRKPSSTA